MKKSITFAILALSFVALAQTNLVPMDPGTNVVKPPTHALPTPDYITQLGQYLVMIIPFVVPALIAGLKTWIPKIPSWALPIIAPALGALADFILQTAGVNTGGVIKGALLGSAGVGIRELIDQVNKRMSVVTHDPIPVAPPPTKP